MLFVGSEGRLCGHSHTGLLASPTTQLRSALSDLFSPKNRRGVTDKKLHLSTSRPD